MFMPRQRLSLIWGCFILASGAFSVASLAGVYPFPEFSVIWNAVPNLPVIISFHLKNISRFGAIGVIMLSMTVVYYTILSSDEFTKNKLNGLIVLISVMVISALCAVNYVQLLVAVGVVDVIVYSIINLPEAKRQYIYGNFLADFMLLCILALIFGQQGNINIAGIEEQSQVWRHRDCIAIMLLACIFIKNGTAFFHTAYQKMSELNFARLNFILFAATPLMGLIILQLLKNILMISQYSYPLLKIFAVAGIVWGGLGALVVDNLKRKSVYLSMFFWGLSLSGFAWLPSFSNRRFYLFLIAAFLFNNILMFFSKLRNDELKMSRLCGVLQSAKLTFGICIISTILYALAWSLFAGRNLWLTSVGLTAFAFISAQILSDAFFANNATGKNNQNIRLFMLEIPVLIALVTLIIYNKQQLLNVWPYIAGCVMVWFAIFISRPLQKISGLYCSDFIQKRDVISDIYNFCVLVPIQVLGRGLRLIVDFMFIEKTVIASIKSAIRIMIIIFRRMHNDNAWNYVLFLLTGIIIIAASYYNGVVK